MDKTALFNISYGMYVVSTLDEANYAGCVVNSIFQVSSTPATVAISIHKNNYTNPCILKTGKFAISILSEQVDRSVIGTFGFRSSKDINKFENIAYTLTDQGLPVLTAGVCSYLTCEVISTTDCYTHTVVIAHITDARKLSDEIPMTYGYYHAVVKGKAPKNAPTFLPEPVPASPKYVCGICGYEYPGDDFADLPDSYICPVCTAPKDVFERK